MDANAAAVRAAILGVLALGASQVGRRQEGVNSLFFVAALIALVNLTRKCTTLSRSFRPLER